MSRDAGGQLDLDGQLWPRTHDLPPRWDGLPIDWGDWAPTSWVQICPPPTTGRGCVRCASTAPPLAAHGRLYTDPVTAPPAIAMGRRHRGRHLIGVLTALRCPNCAHDVIVDPKGRSWDLDPTDYGDDGSFDITDDK